MVSASCAYVRGVNPGVVRVLENLERSKNTSVSMSWLVTSTGGSRPRGKDGMKLHELKRELCLLRYNSSRLRKECGG